ncbi:ABC transporter substrate-binding protein [Streptomyces somaliensis]|uniref:ABC transporter substrate-binding protein n=1 Tax=Streptomyces somaliensis TaxID=78355 RepID=UPI0034E9580E|nr:ABC transporter substrate-binding protein [Streptomyces somaliensis]
MNRKSPVLPAIAGLLAPLLAACGMGTGGDAADGGIVVGTTDRFAVSRDAPAPFDPAYAYDTGAWNVLRQTVQTLMRVPRGGGTPVPDAASQCEFTSGANESYRCVLREGLVFSDGKPVTARDVEYSVERVLAIRSDNGVAALLSNVEAVEARGDREVLFRLKTPDATFPYKLATPVAGIVSSDRYDATRLREGFQVDGSGPYTMSPRVRDGRLVSVAFTRNPRYKGDVTVRNDGVELRSFDDAASMAGALEAGDIDMVTRTLEPELIEKLDVHPQDDVKLTEVPGLEIRYLAFDTEDPAVGNKAVRQAMAALVDRDRLVRGVYGRTAKPLYSLIPSTIVTHSNSFFNKYGDPSRAKAAALLRDADVDTPVKLTLHYTTDHYGAATAREFAALRDQLNGSGLFDVTVRGVEWSSFRPAQKRGDYAVYGLGWFPDFPDPDNYIAPFLDAHNFLNTPYVNEEARKQLIPASRREADRAAAAPAFQRLQDIVAEDVPVLPLWQGKQYVASRATLTGVEWALNTSSDLQLWELGRGDA